MPPPDSRDRGVASDLMRLLRAWIVLLLLGGIEFGASYLPLPPAWRPLLLLPAASMVVVVAVSFMEVRKGPSIVRAFAVSAMFWLLVLLALGSADPLTRTDYAVPTAPVD